MKAGCLLADAFKEEIAMYLTAIFLIGLLASTIGAICGIGGGVIIKPAIDILGLTDVSSTSFLSSCTVLMMTAYTVLNSLHRKQEKKLEMRSVAPLALGAACGGLAGKVAFEAIKASLPFADKIGSYQAAVLGIVALATLLYTLNKGKIKTRKLENPWTGIIFGMALGCMSSFLGIGGGPIDLVVLYYFFSMDTKTAAQNALFIIFVSQAFSISYTVLTSNVPHVSVWEVAVMSAGGILGGMAGRRINQHIDKRAVDKLFAIILLVIVLISIYNFFHFA